MGASGRSGGIAVALAAATLLTGCGAGQGAAVRTSGADPSSSPAADEAPGAPAAARKFRSTRSFETVAAPVRVSIPRLGVDSSLERLGKRPDGTVAVPTAWGRAGWYAHGPRPGQPAAAVILGHVDSPSGPAVFSRLRTLRRGDRVVVRRADGSAVHFAVDRVERHAKDRFPTAEVYYPTLTPGLRLVTCGGPYDRSAGGYQANVIVFASLARPVVEAGS
jgi:Sortase domain